MAEKKTVCADVLLSACRDSAAVMKGTLLIYPSKRYQCLFFRQAMQTEWWAEMGSVRRKTRV